MYLVYEITYLIYEITYLVSMKFPQLTNTNTNLTNFYKTGD